MNEKQISNESTMRPTKKQRQLLIFLESFIAEHGYSPSYREIMSGCQYSSVATVALHISNLIKRGHIRKRDRSARSLELVQASDHGKVTSNFVAASEEKWLVEKVEHAFSELEMSGREISEPAIEQLTILVAALKILGLDGAAHSFSPRLHTLKTHSITTVAN